MAEVADTPVPRRAVRRSRLLSLVALLTYGVVVAVIGLQIWDVSAFPLITTRNNDIAGSLKTIRAGGPPLLECIAASDAQLRAGDYLRLLDEGVCRPAGVTDDQGLSLFVPYVAIIAGTSDPGEALAVLYAASFALAFVLYPLLFRAIFDSRLAALAAPWALVGVGHILEKGRSDHYWVSAWGILIGLPVVMALCARWHAVGRWRWPILAAVGALASAVTAMRINAGLPLVIGALIVILLRRDSWKQAIALGVVVVASYTTVYPFGLDGVRAYRDHVIGDPSLSDRYPARHPFWHNAYIGLGVVPNEYGIEWEDAIATRLVQEKRPDAGYLSPEYERVLRDEYFRLVREDPGLVAENYLVKAATLIGKALSNFWYAVVLIPLSLLAGRRRKTMGENVLVAAPSLVLGSLPILITNTSNQYLPSWYGPVGLFAVLGAAWAVATLPAVYDLRARDLRRALSGWRPWTRRLLRSRWWWSGVAVAALAGSILVLRQVYPPYFPTNDYYALRATPLSPVPDQPALYTWTFSPGLPDGWTLIGATAVPRARSVEVTTDTNPSTYQVYGPEISLPSGTYEARARGEVVSGGLELGVLDVRRDAWLETGRFWSGQTPGADRHMATRFTLRDAGPVRPVLANWSPEGKQSVWRIRAVSFTRVH